MGVPYTFGTATTSIPLSNLDANFNTPVTIGNATVGLGNTVTTVGNLTLTNATISSGNVTVTTGIFGAGSNTAPSITTTGDTNTGIFFPAADTIAFTEGGTEAMRIDSSGNVGIGTSSPATKLDISASSASGANASLTKTNSGTANQNGQLINFLNYGPAATGRNAGTTIGGMYFGCSQPTSGAIQDAGAISCVAETQSGNNTASALVFSTNTGNSGNAERMRIDSSGNVGVNNTSPAVLASTTQIAIKANVSADSMFVAQNSNGLTTAKFGFQFTGSVDQPVIGSQTNHPFLFLTNNTERMRITSGGDLLIGTTNSDARLTVVTGSDEAVYALNTAGANSATMLAWNNAGSGNNYFHAFFVNASPLNVGNIDYNRAGALVRYNTTSDATLKNIFGDSDGQKSVGILKSTRIREYAWKEDAEQKPQIGVIAQELYETYKGAVSVGGENDKGEYRPWGVDKTAFTFHLIAGWQNHEKLIQEQQTLIENLTTRLNALEGK